MRLACVSSLHSWNNLKPECLFVIQSLQYHYNLGMALYTVTRGKDVHEIVFCIADQINNGIDGSFAVSSALQLGLAELNEKAGTKAADSSDYASAHSYFKHALSFLPPDHWKGNYDLSLRLYFHLAESAVVCGNTEAADYFSQQILKEARCLNDKLSAYHLAVRILHNKDAMQDAYMTARKVLLKLGESIPDLCGQVEAKEMLEATSKAMSTLTEESLSGMKEMDEKIQHVVRFYNFMTAVSISAKPSMAPFFSCRAAQLSMKHGICKFSIICESLLLNASFAAEFSLIETSHLH